MPDPTNETLTETMAPITIVVDGSTPLRPITVENDRPIIWDNQTESRLLLIFVTKGPGASPRHLPFGVRAFDEIPAGHPKLAVPDTRLVEPGTEVTCRYLAYLVDEDKILEGESTPKIIWKTTSFTY